jgi:hypothetical protein
LLRQRVRVACVIGSLRVWLVGATFGRFVIWNIGERNAERFESFAVNVPITATAGVGGGFCACREPDDMP